MPDGPPAYPDHQERTEKKQAYGENQTQMPGRYRTETKRTLGNVEILVICASTSVYVIPVGQCSGEKLSG